MYIAASALKSFLIYIKMIKVSIDALMYRKVASTNMRF